MDDSDEVGSARSDVPPPQPDALQPQEEEEHDGVDAEEQAAYDEQADGAEQEEPFAHGDVGAESASGSVDQSQLEPLERSSAEAASSEHDLQQADGTSVALDDSGHPSIPVQITILPDAFVHVESVGLDRSIGELKHSLSARFRIPASAMRLALGELQLEDERLVREYAEMELARRQEAAAAAAASGSDADQAAALVAAPLALTMHLELEDAGGDDGNKQHEEEEKHADGSGGDGGGGGGGDDGAGESYRMPDIIKVVINREQLEIEAEEDEERALSGLPPLRAQPTPEQVVYVQVVRDNSSTPKPFLGGFRHRYLGTVYHHASSQTARRKKKAERVRFHRETQTVQVVSRSQQTAREAGTQMERRDLLQDHSNDRVITSRPYFTADELEALRDEKAREVQCFLRQCFAWRRVRRLREAKADAVMTELRAKEEKAARDAAEHAKQIQRRMHPRTKEDFAVLFAELDAWRLHETQRIKTSGLSSDEVSAALQELLHKEVKLLQTIDRLKLTAAKENKWSRTQMNLEKMASPKEWSSGDGDLIEVETPFTQRARELVDLYNGLCLRSLSRAQRVDVLLHVKYTVKEFDCELSREIVELIKREEDLLRRQRPEASLEGCRKRLQNLFLQFVNTPHFNPEAAHFARVPTQAAVAQPQPALASSLAKPTMLTRSNTITVPNNVTGRIYANKTQQ